MRDVFVIGTGMTRFGRHEQATLLELAEEAAATALRDASLEPADIDALYVGSFCARALDRQGMIAAHVAARLGLGNRAATTVEAACASGQVALRHGVLAVRAGSAQRVLCIGVDRMTPFDTSAVTATLAEAGDVSTDASLGLTFPGFFALVASAHSSHYGTPREHLTAVVRQSRRHGARNDMAMFRAPVTDEQVETSRLIADPLRLFDCSPIADGAAAAVVSGDPAPGAVRVLASEQASGPAAIDHMEELTSFPATRAAVRAALGAAGLRITDVDVVELHDCFTIAAIVDAEDLGLFAPGEAGTAIADGATAVDSVAVTINPSGGLLARGHPVGATGLAQVHELAMQLRGAAATQVPGASIGLAHNLGGTGGVATVTILEAA